MNDMTNYKKQSYMDYNATCPIREEVIEYMAEVMKHTGNASSVHRFGRQARKYIEEARMEVAALVKVKANQVIFNSGATEGNNAIIRKYCKDRILISAIEHPSIFRPAQEFANKCEIIEINNDGVVNLAKFEKLLKAGKKPALVSVMLVNNENGVIQPIEEISKIIKEYDENIIMHTDAVQAAGKMEIDFEKLGVDYMTLSAHKFGGAQGVGAIISAKGKVPPKILFGGGQERRQRAGTENVAGIAAFGMAAKIAGKNIDKYKKNVGNLKNKIENELKKYEFVKILGENSPRICNSILFSIKNAKAETLVMNFDLENIALSNGSACSSGVVQTSHVIEAMGESKNNAALRISLGWASTKENVDHFISVWQKIANNIKRVQ